MNIQIEVVAQPDDFTRYWKPGPNYAALLRAIRSWGVPDVWAAGDPFGRPPRTWAAYVKAGHFGHVHVPGNDHFDPQVRDGSLLFRKEDEFMDVIDPTTGKKHPAEVALSSIWGHSVAAHQDAAVARKLAEAAAKSPQPLTLAEIDDIAAATIAALGKDYTANVTLTPKEA